MFLLLELIRIILLFVLLGSIAQYFINQLYVSLNIQLNTNGSFLVLLGVLIGFFVLYRDKFQFSGFYKGPNQVKLPKYFSVLLICISIILLILAPFI